VRCGQEPQSKTINCCNIAITLIGRVLSGIDSWRARGFYERTAMLYHNVLGAVQETVLDASAGRVLADRIGC